MTSGNINVSKAYHGSGLLPSAAVAAPILFDELAHAWLHLMSCLASALREAAWHELQSERLAEGHSINLNGRIVYLREEVDRS